MGHHRHRPRQHGPPPLRHPGQYADPETGLHYNLNRHYDPTTARYTTPDPLGLAPAPNPVAWVANPYRWLDPLGLAGCDGLDDDTYDRLDDQYGPNIANGVDYQWQRIHDGSGNAADHDLSGIGRDPDRIAQYLQDQVSSGPTHYDTQKKSYVSYDPNVRDAQGRGVLTIHSSYNPHAYHYSQEAFDAGRYTEL